MANPGGLECSFPSCLQGTLSCVCVSGGHLGRGRQRRWGEILVPLALGWGEGSAGGRALVQNLQPPAAWAGALGRCLKGVRG